MKFYPDYSGALNDLPDEMSTFCYGINKGYDEILMENEVLAIFPDQKEVEINTKRNAAEVMKVTDEYYEPIVWGAQDSHNWCFACIQIPNQKTYLQSLWLLDEGSPHSYVEKTTQVLLGLTDKNKLDTLVGNAWRSSFCGDEIGPVILRDSETCANKGVQKINLLGNDIRFHRINFGASLEDPYKAQKNIFFSTE